MTDLIHVHRAYKRRAADRRRSAKEVEEFVIQALAAAAVFMGGFVLICKGLGI